MAGGCRKWIMKSQSGNRSEYCSCVYLFRGISAARRGTRGGLGMCWEAWDARARLGMLAASSLRMSQVKIRGVPSSAAQPALRTRSKCLLCLFACHHVAERIPRLAYNVIRQHLDTQGQN